MFRTEILLWTFLLFNWTPLIVQCQHYYYHSPMPHNYIDSGRQQVTTARPTTRRPVDIMVNVSNFVLLGVLKVVVAVLYALGFHLHVGTVAGKRSVEDNRNITTILDFMWLGTVVFGGPAEISCLRRLVCEDPEGGRVKMNAAKEMLGFFKSVGSLFPEELQERERQLENMEMSIVYGMEGKECVSASCPSVLKLLL